MKKSSKFNYNDLIERLIVTKNSLESFLDYRDRKNVARVVYMPFCMKIFQKKTKTSYKTVQRNLHKMERQGYFQIVHFDNLSDYSDKLAKERKIDPSYKGKLLTTRIGLIPNFDKLKELVTPQYAVRFSAVRTVYEVLTKKARHGDLGKKIRMMAHEKKDFRRVEGHKDFEMLDVKYWYFNELYKSNEVWYMDSLFQESDDVSSIISFNKEKGVFGLPRDEKSILNFNKEVGLFLQKGLPKLKKDNPEQFKVFSKYVTDKKTLSDAFKRMIEICADEKDPVLTAKVRQAFGLDNGSVSLRGALTHKCFHKGGKTVTRYPLVYAICAYDEYQSDIAGNESANDLLNQLLSADYHWGEHRPVQALHDWIYAHENFPEGGISKWMLRHGSNFVKRIRMMCRCFVAMFYASSSEVRYRVMELAEEFYGVPEEWSYDFYWTAVVSFFRVYARWVTEVCNWELNFSYTSYAVFHDDDDKVFDPENGYEWTWFVDWLDKHGCLPPEMWLCYTQSQILDAASTVCARCDGVSYDFAMKRFMEFDAVDTLFYEYDSPEVERRRWEKKEAERIEREREAERDEEERIAFLAAKSGGAVEVDEALVEFCDADYLCGTLVEREVNLTWQNIYYEVWHEAKSWRKKHEERTGIKMQFPSPDWRFGGRRKPMRRRAVDD